MVHIRPKQSSQIPASGRASSICAWCLSSTRVPHIMPKKERYVLRGGKEGYDRLQVLARARWPDTLALFQRAGLAAGMRCLDVGCGGGAVTVELARLVAPQGTVVGVDMDGVKLGLGRRTAAELHLGNVEFREMNVNDWKDGGAYDAIYSRCLLQHLSHPVDLLRRMWAGVRPGGLLIIEDADFDGWCCDPPNESFEFFVRTFEQVARQNGGDATAGRKLYRYFRDAGISAAHVSVVQSAHVSGEGKKLPWLTLEFSTEAILAAGIASPEELRARLASLAAFSEDPSTLISGPRIFQVWARRASAG
jgi:2-polyprenyl-3-methyl-5-hydroxy-6-metoxy-1,4-benzoquinol methylase